MSLSASVQASIFFLRRQEICINRLGFSGIHDCAFPTKSSRMKEHSLCIDGEQIVTPDCSCIILTAYYESAVSSQLKESREILLSVAHSFDDVSKPTFHIHMDVTNQKTSLFFPT